MTTSDGVQITGQSKHFIERVIGTMSAPQKNRPRSGVTVEEAKAALKNPFSIKKSKVDQEGRKSQKYIGDRATVTVNPDNGNLIQCNPTEERLRKGRLNGKI